MEEVLLHFYVYVYLDPRKPGKFKYGEYEFEYEPFYVGKGEGDRFRRHLTEYQLVHDKNKLKVHKIKKIIKEIGKHPIVIKFKDNISEKESFELETKMIITIGRKDLGKGPLTNLTDGGEGISGHVMTEGQKEILRNRAITKETRKRISKANKGRKCKWACKNKEECESLRKQGETFHKKYISGKIKSRDGKNNSNFGNKWSKEQKEEASKKVKGHWIGDLNPNRINPKLGKDNAFNKYKYLIYDGDKLIMETYSLSQASKDLSLNYNMLRKISANGNKYYKRYWIKRILN